MVSVSSLGSASVCKTTAAEAGAAATETDVGEKKIEAMTAFCHRHLVYFFDKTMVLYHRVFC